MIGVKIRYIRELKNISRSSIAQVIGITPGALGRIERGEIDLSVSRLADIANALRVGVQDIIDFNPQQYLVSEENKRNDLMTNEVSTRQSREIEVLQEQIAYLQALVDKLLLTLNK